MMMGLMMMIRARKDRGLGDLWLQQAQHPWSTHLGAGRASREPRHWSKRGLSRRVSWQSYPMLENEASYRLWEQLGLLAVQRRSRSSLHAGTGLTV